MTENPDAAAEEFVERMGLVAQADGLPRIAGRIMAFLVIHGGPFSFGELAERLKVSRGSVSTNTRLLESLGILERVTQAGDRQDYFRLRAHPYRSLLEGYRRRAIRAKGNISDAQHKLPDGWSGAQGRLDGLGAFYDSIIDVIGQLLEKEQ